METKKTTIKRWQQYATTILPYQYTTIHSTGSTTAGIYFISCVYTFDCDGFLMGLVGPASTLLSHPVTVSYNDLYIIVYYNSIYIITAKSSVRLRTAGARAGSSGTTKNNKIQNGLQRKLKFYSLA